MRKYAPDATGNGSVPLLGDYADKWVSTLLNPRSTKLYYRSALNSMWKPAIGHLHLDAVRHSDITQAMSDAKDRGVAGGALNGYRAILSSMYKSAVADKLVATNPVLTVERIKVQEPAPDPFSADEMEMILDWLRRHAPEQLVNYFEFAFCSGIRPSEQIVIKWAGLDWNKSTLKVTQALTRAEVKATKTYKGRTIDVNERAMSVLRRQKEHTFMKDAMVFHNPATDKPWSDGQQQRDRFFYPALKGAGIRHRPSRNTRHTYATMLLMANVPVGYVSKQLGHASVETTLRRYYDWIEGADRGAAAATTNGVFGQSLATQRAKPLI